MLLVCLCLYFKNSATVQGSLALLIVALAQVLKMIELGKLRPLTSREGLLACPISAASSHNTSRLIVKKTSRHDTHHYSYFYRYIIVGYAEYFALWKEVLLHYHQLVVTLRILYLLRDSH
jgi:hypothetical protein